jgi:hypothetical protein
MNFIQPDIEAATRLILVLLMMITASSSTEPTTLVVISSSILLDIGYLREHHVVLFLKLFLEVLAESFVSDASN